MSELKLTEYQQNLFNKHVVHSWSVKIGEKTTVVVIKLENGFEITGTSACVNPMDFVFEIGEHYALVDALNQLDGFIGFMRQEEQGRIVDELIKESVVVSSARISLTNDIFKQDQKDADDILKSIMQGLRQAGKFQ